MIQMGIDYFICLALGTYLFSFVANPEKTGGGFFKVLNVLGASSVLLGLILGAFLDHFKVFDLIYFLLIIFVFLIGFWHYKENDKRGVVGKVLWIFIVLLSIGAFSRFVPVKPHAYFYFFSSLLYLGVINFLMMLGHWYLVTPKLTTKPLINALKIYWIILAFKLVSFVWNYDVFKPYYEYLMTYPPGFSFDVIVLFLKVVIGYLGIFALSIMGYKLVKIPDTQSATGVFYVMVILVFISELMGFYLFYNKGVLL